MIRNRYSISAAAAWQAVMVSGAPASAQGRKVIVDQDARGPASTDMQSILLFLQAPDVDVLGITLVAGDMWLKEETQRTLRAVAGKRSPWSMACFEICGSTPSIACGEIPNASYPAVPGDAMVSFCINSTWLRVIGGSGRASQV